MIFQFPDLETLRLAITSGVVPTSVSLAGAEVAADDKGHVSVKPAGGIPSKAMQNALKKLGVKAGKEHVAEPQHVSSWLQGLPLVREAGVPELAANAPVLFELAASAMPVLVGEMLRLGNDRQSYRYLADAEGEQRVLLRVIGPPYYTLLRAIDKLEFDGARVVAYLERSPNVWVEIGWNHPLATSIRPPEKPEKQILLMRPPRDWTFIGDAPFHDIYDILDFKLPRSTVEWEEGELPGKLTVPLRLVAGNAADVTEMWVLRDDAVYQLDALVRDADERLMARLSFAVAEEADGTKTIIVRTRPSKLAPPVLSLEGAVCFKPYWKLPNLFVPVGKRLQPQLRRDAVRRLLAEDPAQIVWLMPGEDGGFVPEGLPDEAFRPLEDWVHYVIDHERQPLTSWVQATQFDFEPFVCKDDQPDKPKPPPGERGKRKRPGRDDSDDEDDSLDIPSSTAKGGKKKGGGKPAEDAFLAPVVVAPPSELKKKRTELEDRFKQIDGPLDAPERLELWPELAQLNAALGEPNDAAICWSNALWERDDLPPNWAAEWARGELAGLKWKEPDALTVIDRVLKLANPSLPEVRALVAAVVWGSAQEPTPPGLEGRLPEVRKFLEVNEKWVGIRGVWIAWLRLTKLSGADVLGLARARDRLLQRLLDDKGLNKEKDLPTFLRLGGARDSERVRAVREKVMELRRLVQKWVTLDSDAATELNRAYVNLIFAFGVARLGEVHAARNELLVPAREVLLAPRDNQGKRIPNGKPDPVHAYLLDAFTYRIEHALAGMPHAGPLSPELLQRRDGLEKMSQYVVDRMRQQSSVLEPQERFDPYRQWKKHSDDLLKELSELPDVGKPSDLERRIRKLVQEGGKARHTPEQRAIVLKETLPLAPRVGEPFTAELLQLVPGVLDAVAGSADPQTLEIQAGLMERALFQAAHFDRKELIEMLTGRFVAMLKGKSGKALHEVIDKLGGQCLGSLRKVGMRDEIRRLFGQMADQVLQGQSLAQLRAKHSTNWWETVRVLLRLAEGWLYFGDVQTAVPFLDEARVAMFDEAETAKLKQPLEYTTLACTYASVLGQAPVEVALPRIEEMFKKMAKLPNTFTTATHYSRLHLNVVDAVVLAVVSEDFALGPTARRWLDDDEYLVRRRIHRDMKSHLSHSGL